MRHDDRGMHTIHKRDGMHSRSWKTNIGEKNMKTLNSAIKLDHNQTRNGLSKGGITYNLRKGREFINLGVGHSSFLIKKGPRNYNKQFDNTYSSKRDALPDAAQAMLDLNGYCMSDRCRESEMDHIYNLKYGFIRYLYKEGFSTNAGVHWIERPALLCSGCDGFGCDKCGQTGEYREADYIEYVVFHFNVDGVSFRWHQPRWIIDYDFEITNPNPPMPDVSMRNLQIETKTFRKAESIALIKWVMANKEDDTTAA